MNGSASFRKFEDRTDLPSNLTLKENRENLKLSNNFINWLRGPFRLFIDAPIRLTEICTRTIHIDEKTRRAIEQALSKQKQNIDGVVISSIPFVEITSEWKFLYKNPDRGFSSASVWLQNPQGQRILAKIQDHPMCAANEWFAHILGKYLDLPVNEVQIGIYRNDLVTLHTDVANDNEQAMTFLDLSRHLRQKLINDSTIESMNFFDRLMINVDRNPRNLLITINKSNENSKLKLHLIDHSSCFGMGQLNIISAIACKFHSRHFCVVKFDPNEQANKFEQYLQNRTEYDRCSIQVILQRFSSITDELFDIWLGAVRDLLTENQYKRIRHVLRQERDVVKAYVTT